MCRGGDKLLFQLKVIEVFFLNSMNASISGHICSHRIASIKMDGEDSLIKVYTPSLISPNYNTKKKTPTIGYVKPIFGHQTNDVIDSQRCWAKKAT